MATASSNTPQCSADHPAIAQFPGVMQKLLVREALALEKRIAEGKGIPGFDEYLIRDSVGDHRVTVASLGYTSRRNRR